MQPRESVRISVGSRPALLPGFQSPALLQVTPSPQSWSRLLWYHSIQQGQPWRWGPATNVDKAGIINLPSPGAAAVADKMSSHLASVL